MTKRIIGLIPAAGYGTRFNWLVPKEMFPYDHEEIDGKICLKPISRSVFDLMLLAGAQIVYFVINRTKSAVIDYYGNGSRFGVKVGYLVQERPTGLAGAIEEIEEFCSDSDVILFGMPDTLMNPQNVFVNLKEKLLESEADVSLGLFLSDRPEMFGTVILDENDEFVECEDKPLVPRSKWIWGAMAFRKTFVCVSVKSQENREVQVADMLNKAKQIGLKMDVSKYLDGQYHDVGTLENLLEYMKRNIRISSIESNK